MILLDALNQLSDGHDLQWLASRLVSSVRVIVSCVDDAAAKTEVQQRVLQKRSRRAGPRHCVTARADDGSRMCAPLSSRIWKNTARSSTVHRSGRDLRRCTQMRNPLYLLVMLNELRTLGGNDMKRIVPALIATMPQDHS